MSNIVGKPSPDKAYSMQRGMPYPLLWTYALYYVISRLPNWWTKKAMPYKGLCPLRGIVTTFELCAILSLYSRSVLGKI
jgi:hypothetical protein